MNDDCKHYIKLCAIPEIGAVTAMRLIRHFGSPQAVLEADKSALLKVEKIGNKTADSIISNRDKIDVEKIAARMDVSSQKVCRCLQRFVAFFKNSAVYCVENTV